MSRRLKSWQIKLINLAWILIGTILLVEFTIDVQRAGDFQGYINAGQLVLDGGDIYSDYLNTWPPLFSIFSVPLTLMDNLSPLLVRVLWLFGSLTAMGYAVIISAKMLTNMGIGLRPMPGKLSYKELLILVPVLLSLKYVMDNMANLQINIYLLLLCLLVIRQFTLSRYYLAGMLLALGISLKIYPLFLFLYFLYKREFKVVIWTLAFVVLFNSVSFLVFGWEQALEYYLRWQEEVTPRSFMANHKNQSYFGVMLRLFTNLDPDHGLFTNIMNVEPKLIKRITYLVIMLAALIPALMFRRKIKEPMELSAILEYSFVLTAIPLLSPIAWKAYFIFLWPGIFISYVLLFRTENDLKKMVLKRLRIAFWLSMILVIGSAEIFVGPHISDVLESYSVISAGNTILLVVILNLVARSDSFEKKSYKLSFLTTRRE